MDNIQINELMKYCENQHNYVRNLIEFCIGDNVKSDYKILEQKFMFEISRKYDHIIRILLQLIDKNIMGQIIIHNEEKIFEYVLKFKKIPTVELFLQIVLSNTDDEFIRKILNKKHNWKFNNNSEIFNLEFLHIILSGEINPDIIVKIISKISNTPDYLEFKEFPNVYLNYISLILRQNPQHIIQIIQILTDKYSGIYNLVSMPIKYDKSNPEKKFNLFESIVRSFCYNYGHDTCVKLLNYLIGELGDRYIEFVTTHTDIDMVITTSLCSEYFNKKLLIFNGLWRDDFYNWINVNKLIEISYWKTTLLFEALCVENYQFVKSLLLDDQISQSIDWTIKYSHNPHNSLTHTFISYVLYMLNYGTNLTSEQIEVLEEILYICFEQHRKKIVWDTQCIKLIMGKSKYFDKIFELDKNFIQENISEFNCYLIEYNRLEQIGKIEQTSESVKYFHNGQFKIVCGKNNLDFAKYLTGEYLKFYSIEDLDVQNQIIESFELACEKNYVELSNWIFSTFIEFNLDYLVGIKYDNFSQSDEILEKYNKNKKNKKNKKNNNKIIGKNYYFNNIINYCGINKNYLIVTKLFDVQYNFNYFMFDNCDDTFLFMIIKYSFPNDFIIKVIDKFGELLNPQYQNKKSTDTALILSSKLNNITIFNYMIKKFGDKVHPKIYLIVCEF